MFTQPCFIRKNTPELRKKLEELGYVSHIFNNNDANNIYADKLGTYISVDIENQPYYIDCETNEELFLALAALRDDTDINQYFVCDKVSFTLGKTYYPDDYLYYQYDEFFDKQNWHKATVKEIIEHFKNKKL